VNEQLPPEPNAATRHSAALRRNAAQRAARTVARLQDGVAALTRAGPPITGPLIKQETGLDYKTIQRNPAYALFCKHAAHFTQPRTRKPSARTMGKRRHNKARASAAPQPTPPDPLLERPKRRLVDRIRVLEYTIPSSFKPRLVSRLPSRKSKRRTWSCGHSWLRHNALFACCSARTLPAPGRNCQPWPDQSENGSFPLSSQHPDDRWYRLVKWRFRRGAGARSTRIADLLKAPLKELRCPLRLRLIGAGASVLLCKTRAGSARLSAVSMIHPTEMVRSAAPIRASSSGRPPKDHLVSAGGAGPRS
jgi:hypothetical protein